MLINFDQMPDNARVWIYTANRLLNEKEIESIQQRLGSFLNEWASHGNPLKASGTVIDQAAVVIAVEDGWETASGCSIDKSVRVLKELEQELELSFFDRMKIWYRPYVGASVQCLPMVELKKGLSSGEKDAKGGILDTQLTTVQQVREQLWVPVKDSWLAKLVPGMMV